MSENGGGQNMSTCTVLNFLTYKLHLWEGKQNGRNVMIDIDRITDDIILNK